MGLLLGGMRTAEAQADKLQGRKKDGLFIVWNEKEGDKTRKLQGR